MGIRMLQQSSCLDMLLHLEILKTKGTAKGKELQCIKIFTKTLSKLGMVSLWRLAKHCLISGIPEKDWAARTGL